MNIKQALTTLDPSNDDHWTSDGLPRVETVAGLVGGDVTRKNITDAAPSFLRPQGSGFDPVGAPTPEPTPDPTPEPDEPAEPAVPETTEDTSVEQDPVAPPEESDPQPESDSVQAAHVTIMDDVVGMSPNEVFRDLDLVDRAIDEFGRQSEILTARREAIMVQLKDIGRRSALLSGARNKLTRMGAKTNKPTTIQNYLRAQQEARAQRALRAQRFIEAGTTAEDVKEQLGGASKIDAAMKQRKVARGAARPAYPVTVGK